MQWLDPSPAAPAARLLVHADEAGGDADGALPRFLLRVRAWARAAACDGLPAVRMRITDLQGRQYFAADALPSLVDLPLPAGTYHVNVSYGGRQRHYTLVLEQGATLDLHLRVKIGRL